MAVNCFHPARPISTQHFCNSSSFLLCFPSISSPFKHYYENSFDLTDPLKGSQGIPGFVDHTMRTPNVMLCHKALFLPYLSFLVIINDIL